MKKQLSFEQLIEKNKEELIQDEKIMEIIEQKLDAKYVDNNK